MNVFDIIRHLCCGTGTIGQCVAKSVKHVYGIELSEEAVADAKENANINGMIDKVTNVKLNIAFRTFKYHLHRRKSRKCSAELPHLAVNQPNNCSCVSFVIPYFFIFVISFTLSSDPPRPGLRKCFFLF